jgi:hypothetical protein
MKFGSDDDDDSPRRLLGTPFFGAHKQKNSNFQMKPNPNLVLECLLKTTF